MEYSRVLDGILTDSDVARAIGVLDGLVVGLDKGGVWKELVENKVELGFVGMIEELKTIEAAADKKKLVGELRLWLEGRPEIELTVARMPTMKELVEMVGVIRKRVKDAVVDLSTEPGIIGGAVVVYQGRYGDYSVKRAIRTLISTAKPQKE